MDGGEAQEETSGGEQEVPAESPTRRGAKRNWTLLSNHAHVLVYLAKDPDARLRDVAEAVGITERGVFRVINELEEGGVVRRNRIGRRNRYEIVLSAHLRHPLEATRTVGSLLALLLEPREAEALGIVPISTR